MTSKLPFVRLGLGLAVGVFAAAGPGEAQSPPPTFEEVMAAPDDAGLNLRFAISAARTGDLLSAQSALERVLIAQPGWHGARLLYAGVLYRLQDYQGASVQLGMVDAQALSDLEQREAARYQDLLDGQRGATHFDGQIALGVSYDDDVPGALSALAPLAASQDGVSRVGTVSLELETRLGERSWLFGTLSHYDRAATSGPPNDLTVSEAVGGLRGSQEAYSWQTALTGRNYRLFDKNYLEEVGGRIRLGYAPNALTSWTLTVEGARQDFKEPAVDAVATTIGGTRDGDRLGATLSMTQRFSNAGRAFTYAGYEDKDASYRPFGYRSTNVGAGFDTRLGKGTLSGLADARRVEYDRPDTFYLAGATRKETRTRGRLAYSLPISAFSRNGATGTALDGLSLQAAALYNRRNASTPLADYESWGGELTLTWRFGDRR